MTDDRRVAVIGLGYVGLPLAINFVEAGLQVVGIDALPSRVAELNRIFSALSLGFVDAAVVAIGESLGLLRIATTDRRDFEPMAPALSLELLP